MKDEIWMRQALTLAEKGRGRTSPNPLVGALVLRRGKIVGEGYHGYFGGPHAEAVALKKAGKRARGATLYVTLEPCSSWGKTPPCVDAVIASRVARVVIGSADPNPKNYFAGIQKLRRAKIKVRASVLAGHVERQNQPFFKRMRTGLPFVTLKMAQSLDGKIATRTGVSRWISSKKSREWVHSLRDQVDAVLVGKNTALLDNPSLQGAGEKEKPWRVVLDPDLELPRTARLFKGSQLTFVVISEKKLRELPQSSRQNGRTYLPVPEKRGKLELKPLFQELASLGVNHLLVEGGGELAWSLLSQRLVDRLIWIVAPKIVGGRTAKTSVEGEGVRKLEKAFNLRFEKTYPLGEDWVFEAVPERKSE